MYRQAKSSVCIYNLHTLILTQVCYIEDFALSQYFTSKALTASSNSKTTEKT